MFMSIESLNSKHVSDEIDRLVLFGITLRLRVDKIPLNVKVKKK